MCVFLPPKAGARAVSAVYPLWALLQVQKLRQEQHLILPRVLAGHFKISAMLT